MRIAVVHGYFLGDSGSAIYARELAREFAKQGHDITLVCQEQSPEQYDFIDSAYDVDPQTFELLEVFARKPLYSGRCRLARPAIGDRLLTYVAGPFPPFDAVPFQNADDDWLQAYVEMNVKSMTSIFKQWPQDLVQANHAVMQPWIVRQALHGSAPCIATIHGSELNFTVKKDPRMVPYMLEGLEGAVAIAALSETSREEVIGLAEGHGLSIGEKTAILPPGVDTVLFRPLVDRTESLAGLADRIDPLLDDIAVFAGRLLWTKGLQYAVAALPIILQWRPRMQMIVVGDGPMRGPLKKLIDALGQGDLPSARQIASARPELQSASGYGTVIPDMDSAAESAYMRAASGVVEGRIHFTGHLPHERLAPLFAAADISLAPSVFPEAFGLVSIEALAAGAIPVATYQSGLRNPLDVIAGELSDQAFKELTPERDMTVALAGSVATILEKYPTRNLEFREKLHIIAERNFSWATVARGYLDLGK
ncbi:MAG: glycosyltransferase family 4 protein [Thermoleophilia bacterium]